METPVETKLLERCYKIIISDLEYLERLKNDILIVDPHIKCEVCKDCYKIAIEPTNIESLGFDMCNIFLPKLS